MAARSSTAKRSQNRSLQRSRRKRERRDCATPPTRSRAFAAGLTGKSFSYFGTDERRVKDKETLARIKRLAIPPAWTDVWISPHANGHIQATGRDARGRKQYRYHADWREQRDENKFDRMVAFARVLPRIRRRVQRDLARRGMPREKTPGDGGASARGNVDPCG
jgi:DNA topoisomerase IB